jgi:hypothetical protein
MDSQRAQILQSMLAESFISTVCQHVTYFLKGSQWAQNIITKGLNDGITASVPKGMKNKP